MSAAKFMRSLANLQSPDAFNPYRDTCSVYDLDGAPSVRAQVLQQMLECAENSDIDAIWVGRDLGHRGGRRTGLALTDDVHYRAHAMRWHVSAPVSTKGPAVSERTASVIWSVLTKLQDNVFLWNVFPLHPHQHGEPLSNRAHSARERAMGEAVLLDLVQLLSPRRLIAIGKDASKSAMRCAGGLPVYSVRHPSYGGQNEFLSGIRQVYSDRLSNFGEAFKHDQASQNK